MAYQLTVIYHHPRDAAAFDEHYASVHAPLAARLPGLRTYTYSRPDPGRDGTAGAHLVATLTFDDATAFNAAMRSDTGRATSADFGNFATGGATVLTGEVTAVV